MTEEAEHVPDESWLQEYDKRLEEKQAEARAQLAALCGRLVELGVRKVEFFYDGCGDSGAIDQVTAVGATDEQKIDLPGELHQQLVEQADEILPFGWENECGAFGTIALDVQQRHLKLEHNERYESYERVDQEWSL
jgi:Family of unknown function (DUF6878)